MKSDIVESHVYVRNGDNSPKHISSTEVYIDSSDESTMIGVIEWPDGPIMYFVAKCTSPYNGRVAGLFVEYSHAIEYIMLMSAASGSRGATPKFKRINRGEK